jgi:nicotinamidase-related amidase
MNRLNNDNSILLFVDFQPGMIKGLKSTDLKPEEIIHAAKIVASVAYILDVPIVTISINEKLNGKSLIELSENASHSIERKYPCFNALEDEEVAILIDQYKEIGYTDIVVAGLWSSICMDFTTRGLLQSGWNVHGLFDCTGDATQIAHKMALKSMIQSGVMPMTWSPVIFSWLGSWSHPKAKEIGALFHANMHKP